MKLTPLADNVLLKHMEAAEKTASGIILSTASKEKSEIAEVILQFVNSYLSQTKSGIFIGVGLIMLLWTCLLYTSSPIKGFQPFRPLFSVGRLPWLHLLHRQ